MTPSRLPKHTPSAARSSPLASLALLGLALCLSSLAAGWDVAQPVAALKEAEPVMSRAARLLRDGEAIDVNHADADELELLPRIGPAMARRIIEGRPYADPRELLGVRGIGPRTYERLETLVRTCVSAGCQTGDSVD
ncbi:MAG: ComEA family DNA-binding protein [Polyangiales bacterium]